MTQPEDGCNEIDGELQQEDTLRTLAPYAHRYLKGRHDRGEITSSTRRNLAFRLESIVDSFGARPIQKFGPKAIERWLRSVGHLSAATRRAYLCTVRGLCRWLVKTHVLAVDPTTDVPRVRQPRSVPRALPATDVGRVLAVVPDARAKAIVWLMVGLGLRCCEVARLELGDYDRVAATVFVVGKAANERVVPVPPEAAAALDRYIAATGTTPGPLIRSKNHPARHLMPHTVSVLTTGWMVEAGVKQRAGDGVTPHAFRHTAASDVLDNCLDVRVVQAMLGHAHLSSSAIYLRRANLGQMRAAMAGRDYGVTSPLRPAQMTQTGQARHPADPYRSTP